jgi:hypothetical protein
MATSSVVPDDQSVYRGLRNANWSKNGRITWKAFILRPATVEFPIEEELSLGLNKASAVDELKEHFGWAALSVKAVHSLEHGLVIRVNPSSDQKADLFGLPLHSTDPDQIDLARTMATDLAIISEYLSPD